jgi:hypothetical protein
MESELIAQTRTADRRLARSSGDAYHDEQAAVKPSFSKTTTSFVSTYTRRNLQQMQETEPHCTAMRQDHRGACQ